MAGDTEMYKRQWYSKAIESMITTLFPACFTICGFLIWHTYTLLRDDVKDNQKANAELRQTLSDLQATHAGLREVMMSEVSQLEIRMKHFESHIEDSGYNPQTPDAADKAADLKSKLEWKLKERVEIEQRDLNSIK